jgi:epoxide hydrolase-like predicted phosphatase
VSPSWPAGPWRWPALAEVRALVIDFGGVLTTSLGDAFRAFCRREGADYEKVRAALKQAYGDMDPDSMVARFEKGLVAKDEFEIHLAGVLSEDLREPLDPKDLIARMLEDVRIDQAMVAAVRATRRAGIRTALLSNSWGVDYYPRELLEELFEEVVISGEVGMRKPDPDAYLHTAERLGLRPEECVFVDDHDDNVDAARRIGMRTVHHRETPKTVEEMEKALGVSLGVPAARDSGTVGTEQR